MKKNIAGLNLNLWQRLLLSFLPPFLAGFLGSLTMNDGLQVWYVTLTKPFFNPPGWVFGPVWTILYFLMGLATWIILKRRYGLLQLKQKELQRQALQFYLVQIILNFLWSPVFFAFRSPMIAAFILISLLVIFIQMTIIYARLDKRTLWCLIPNIAWLAFATLLNLSVVFLN